jgi:hypothetical protein
MDALERANKLRQEADQIIQLVRLHEILMPSGEVFFTGSYLLDVMVYPDIDLYIPKVSIDQVFGFGAQFGRLDPVSQVVFERSNDPSLPDGLYLKLRVAAGEWERPWKIDIWSLDEAVIAQKIEPMTRFKQRMTPELREKIICYKMSIINSAHRTPMYSGYFTYKAILDEGITDPEEIRRYLIDNGINFEKPDRD